MHKRPSWGLGLFFSKRIMNQQLSIKKEYKRSQNKLKLRAFLLVTPLLVFICVLFLIPILRLLSVSVDNQDMRDLIPLTREVIQDWDEKDPPTEEVYAAFISDLEAADARDKDGIIARRLNYERAGARSLVRSLSRRAANMQPPYKEKFISLNEAWGESDIWRIIKRESGSYSPSYYVAALDLQYSPQGNFESRPDYQRIYIKLFIRTLIISAVIVFLCFILGYPIAYLLSTLEPKYANLLMILVLLPFWTSLLVRTTSWIVLLQSQGVINDLLVTVGLINDESRLSLVYNMAGTIIAMTHILLPFMILPLYSVMKTIPPNLMRASISMGANWLYSFFRVYFKLSLPGVSAGGLLVFILAIGYYITPALVGGSTGQFISNLIAYHVLQSLNWGLASALSAMLLFCVLILYWVYNRMVGIDKLSF